MQDLYKKGLDLDKYILILIKNDPDQEGAGRKFPCFEVQMLQGRYQLPHLFHTIQLMKNEI